jgi:hypothetical protein
MFWLGPPNRKNWHRSFLAQSLAFGGIALLPQIVKHRRAGEFESALVIVADAVARRVLLERAAQVVLAIYHHPTIAVADAFQRWRDSLLHLDRPAAFSRFAAVDALDFRSVDFAAI